MTQMEPVLTAAAMREADRFTIEDFGIPGRTLMETAGRDAALFIERRFDSPRRLRAAIYCGKGNNGGDGFVLARYLYQHGAHVEAITLGEVNDMSGDAAANFHLLRKMEDHNDDGRLRIRHLKKTDELPAADVHVDALLGTGITSDLREPILGLVKRLNEQQGLRIAIDIPTGLHADYGAVLGAAFRAHATITMGALKAGLCLNQGPDYAGDIHVVDIGIPPHALVQPATSGADGCALRSTDESVRDMLPRRPADAHKYSVGFALTVAGAAGMTGAPVMASEAAARAGAGYVTCACDHRIQDVLGTKMTEITTIALPAADAGIDPDGAMNALANRLEKVDAALIGCGLGKAESTAEFIRAFLKKADFPLVVDADGINALAGHIDLLRRHARGRWIVTPHMGEFKRLAGGAFDESDIRSEDRIRLASRFAREWNCVLILKGMPSVVAASDGRAWIPSTGNTGLASAGTGDVLAGVCTGLLAQGLSPEHAAIAGLHLSGAAADRYAGRRDSRTLQATDLIEALPYVMKERFRKND